MKAVIFDMDGVIFDTEIIWKDALEKANIKFNLSLDDKYRESIVGKSELLIRKELKERYPNLDIDTYRSFILGYVNSEIDKGNYSVKHYFLELVNCLKENNYKIALATSSTKERALKLFNNKNLDINIFDSFVFSDDVGDKGKPNPYIFECAAKKLLVEPFNSYVIEDSTNGLTAAINGNFIPIMVIDLIKPNEYLKKNVKYIFNSLEEVKKIL